MIRFLFCNNAKPRCDVTDSYIKMDELEASLPPEICDQRELAEMAAAEWLEFQNSPDYVAFAFHNAGPCLGGMH